MWKKSTFAVVALGVLVAIELVLERMIAIPVGDITRFSLGKVVVIMAGMWFGPVGGALVGMVSDILGALMQGYSIAPMITLSSMIWGIIPALVLPLIRKNNSKLIKTVIFCVSIVVTAVVCVLVVTPIGLHMYYGYAYMAMLPARLVQFAVMAPTYCVICSLLYYSPVTSTVYNLLHSNVDSRARA